MFEPQAKAWQQRERPLYAGQNHQHHWCHLFGDDELYLWESDEANYINATAGIRLGSLCIPPVNTIQDGGQTKSLWGCNCGKVGLRGRSSALYVPSVNWKYQSHFVCECCVWVCYGHKTIPEPYYSWPAMRPMESLFLSAVDLKVLRFGLLTALHNPWLVPEKRKVLCLVPAPPDHGQLPRLPAVLGHTVLLISGNTSLVCWSQITYLYSVGLR